MAPKVETYSRYSREVQRAVLPELMLVEDVRLALGIETTNGARKAMRSGRYGTCIRLGRRIAIRRVSFLAALKDLEQEAEAEAAVVREA